MAIAVWPVTLPQGLLMDGNETSLPDGRISSQPSAGPQITRQRFTAVEFPIRGHMFINDAQLLIFLNFEKTTLLGGSLPFTFPIPAPWSTVYGTAVKFGQNKPKIVNISGQKHDLMLDLLIQPYP